MGQKVSPWTVVLIIAIVVVIVGFFYMRGSVSSIPEDERLKAQQNVSGQASTLPMKGGGPSPIAAARGGGQGRTMPVTPTK